MDDCNCNEKGYQQLPSNNSWNQRCDSAVYLLLALAISLTALLSSRKLSSPTSTISISIGLLLVAGCLIAIYRRPSILLDLPSSLITSKTRTEEFLPLEMFPDYHLFEENFTEIKKEVDQLLSSTRGGKDLTLTRDTYSGENAYIGGDVTIKNGETTGWRVLNIKAGDTFSPYAKHFPTLKRLLRRSKNVAACVVSVLEPGVTIPIHVGYYKGIMRYMIPTHVPKERDKVFLCVNGKKYNWTEGKSVLWDDTFPHKVYNYTDEIRVVIYMDVIRPLPGWLNSFNQGMISLAANSGLVKKEVQKTEKQIKL